MTKKRSSWRAKFVSQKISKLGVPYRTIEFVNVINEDNFIVKDHFVIDGLDSLKIIGPLNKGDLVSFGTDEDFKNIEFYYPHGQKHGG